MRLVDFVTAGMLLVAGLVSSEESRASVTRPVSDEPVVQAPVKKPARPEPPLPPAPKVRSELITSPATWVTTDDYPKEALRLNVEGITGFRLYIDETGKVADCWITRSSGLEILDKTACDLVKERALFRPARGEKNQPVKDVYSNRIRWEISRDQARTLADSQAHILMAIDRMGKVQDCMVADATPAQDYPPDGPCVDKLLPPPYIALRARSYGIEDVRLVEWLIAIRIDRVRAEELIADMPGRTIAAAGIWHFELNDNGSLARCSLEQQKGDAVLLANLCATMLMPGFVPLVHDDLVLPAREGWAVLSFSHKAGP